MNQHICFLSGSAHTGTAIQSVILPKKPAGHFTWTRQTRKSIRNLLSLQTLSIQIYIKKLNKKVLQMRCKYCRQISHARSVLMQ